MSANCVRAALGTALLAVLAIALAACRQEGTSQTSNTSDTGKNEQELVDNGPNAGLSNEVLVSMAITNMKALNSYQFDFLGEEFAGGATPIRHLNMTGYELLPDKGMRATIEGEHQTVYDTQNVLAIVLGIVEALGGRTDMTVVGGQVFASVDKGNTWHQVVGGDFSGMTMLFVCTWDASGTTTSSTGDLVRPCVNMVNASKLTADTPRTEVIDGVLTRHLATDLLATHETGKEMSSLGQCCPVMLVEQQETLTLEVWVSTGAMPAILRVRVDGTVPPAAGDTTSPGGTSGTTYSLIWTWSRFNEDFGVIEPPPIETMR